jgi:hypothetical protein
MKQKWRRERETEREMGCRDACRDGMSRRDSV